MATIVNTSRVGGPQTPAKVALATSGDLLTYVPGAGQQLTLYNTSVSDVVVTIDGSLGTTVPVAGTSATFSVAAGLAITVLAGQFSSVMLDSVSAYCNGVVAISAATGAVVMASILQ